MNIWTYISTFCIWGLEHKELALIQTKKICWNPGLLISTIAIAGDTIDDTFRLSLDISAILYNFSIEVSVSLAKFTHFDTDTFKNLYDIKTI